MKTGIHIVRCNVGAVESHNERRQEYLDALIDAGKPLYFFPDLTCNNSSWINPRYAGKSCQMLFDERLEWYGDKHRTKAGKPKRPILEDRVRVNKKTGKEYKVAGWSPIREGCPPIKEDTRIEDFQPVIDWARENGLDVIRIDLHHDEGHEEETIDKSTKGKKKERKLNRHAHVVFDWINPETGETVKLDDAKMSELQTVLANSLGMERGESKKVTGTGYVSHKEFREAKANKHVIELEGKIEELTNTIDSLQAKAVEQEYSLEGIKAEIQIETSRLNLAKNAAQGVKEGVIDIFTGKSRKRAQKAISALSEANEEAKTKEEEYKQLLDAQRKQYDDQLLASRIGEDKWKTLFEKIFKQANELHSENNRLIGSMSEVEADKRELQEQLNSIRSFYQGCAEIGLSVQQAHELHDKGETETNSLALPDHDFIVPAPNKTKKGKWHLRYESEAIMILVCKKWHTVVEWTEAMIKKYSSKLHRSASASVSEDAPKEIRSKQSLEANYRISIFEPEIEPAPKRGMRR